MSQPTRFPSGVSTAETGVYFNLPFPDPSRYIFEHYDFFNYVAGDWTVTKTDAGATQALSNGLGGQLLITNTAADDDLVSLQRTNRVYTLTAGKQTFFKTRFKVSDATQSDVLFGIVLNDTTPFAHTDGIVFRKDDGDAQIDFASTKNSVSSSATNIGTLVSDTFIELGFWFDGKNFHLYVDGIKKEIITSAIFCNDELLTQTMALQNGEAVAKTMTIDYITVAQER